MSLPEEHTRPCSTHEEWESLTLEKKVEVLRKWADLMTDWAEKLYLWQGRVRGVMDALSSAANLVEKAVSPFIMKDDGGTPPPKSPGSPKC
jgi:hypothetical protein